VEDFVMSRSKLVAEGGQPALRAPLPAGGHGVELIDEEEISAASDVLRSKKLWRFAENSQCSIWEREISEWLGVRHGVLVNSGTSALTCALAAWQVGPGDEVIVPGYTYIATAAAALNVGAVPVIAEIDESLGLDPEDFRRKITPRTRAVIPVHMQGVPCRMDDIRRVAREHNHIVIEDCCQAVGSRYRGRPTGAERRAHQSDVRAGGRILGTRP